ncbi:hypothetical protein [Mycolicibacterium sp. P1-5]|uniref:hypothetical protein n=1 Tax=Mycolicibacterium sp. P1-5 TaxID=2024617 RepID=UPI0011EFAEB5|nr:hypothetical protein [Mycolicibacterium sp. P1-5]KAA0107610.1 hypothetical protein CIW47_18510 [Mycolicibacterium sp. P1-5]
MLMDGVVQEPTTDRRQMILVVGDDARLYTALAPLDWELVQAASSKEALPHWCKMFCTRAS